MDLHQLPALTWFRAAGHRGASPGGGSRRLSPWPQPHPGGARAILWLLLTVLSQGLPGAEYHVSVNGRDDWDGSATKPLRTISAAARRAQPGDVITVHSGTYREWVRPPRGGESDTRRIVYQAAPGETVIIKGSEVIRSWKRLVGSVWMVVLPNSFFGPYNPYQDVIVGDWFVDNGRPHHTGEVYLNGRALYETHLFQRVLDPRPDPDSLDPEGSTWTWFCESDQHHTYIYANFHDKNPNEELVEINVRPSCFYPTQPGCHYITVRGFRMCHAATQWAAPTAEQIGLLGTHWSKGWIIESNIISHSKCAGITLGKDRATGHNVWSKDPTKDGATHYNEVINRALAAGWSRQTVGSHIVRHNTIFNCEQAGICGSLGAIFSTITNNHIYNIWTKRQFAGAEIAGLKLHAAIDVRIERNRIHNAHRGIWLDWMAQGTRVTRNLCYHNDGDDLFVEVNHGPFLVDNNLLLSRFSLRDWSQGGAYAHNLFLGKIDSRPELKRSTPYHQPHSTAVAGLSRIEGGDNRFYNNLFIAGPEPEWDAHDWDRRNPRRVVGFGLWVYDARELPLYAAGNVYYRGARPAVQETNPVVAAAVDLRVEVVEEGDRVFVQFDAGPELQRAQTVPVTTALLGKAAIPQLPYENPDGSPLTVDMDYLGNRRSSTRPTPGPFENPGQGRLRLRVW